MSAVVGLDLSLTCTGLALIGPSGLDDYEQSVYTHRVKSSGKKDAPAQQTALRIEAMARQILTWIFLEQGENEWVPDLAVIESPSFGSNGGAAHERGGLWWWIAGELASAGVAIATVAPKTRAIYGVGHGSGSGTAGKREVKEATQSRYGHLCEIPDDNVADAVLLAAMGARHLHRPIDEGLVPTSHLRAMESSKWPT